MLNPFFNKLFSDHYIFCQKMKHFTNHFWNHSDSKIFWIIKHLLLWSKRFIFHNIFQISKAFGLVFAEERVKLDQIQLWVILSCLSTFNSWAKMLSTLLHLLNKVNKVVLMINRPFNTWSNKNISFFFWTITKQELYS